MRRSNICLTGFISKENSRDITQRNNTTDHKSYLKVEDVVTTKVTKLADLN